MSLTPAGMQNYRTIKVFSQSAFATGGSLQKVVSAYLAQRLGVWIRLANLVNAPTFSLKVFDVCPEPANQVTPASTDEVQHGSTITFASAGVKKVDLGLTEATPALLANRLDFQGTMSGAGATADVEVWIEIPTEE